MNKFELRDASQAASELNLWLRVERERGASDSELLSSIEADFDNLFSEAIEQGERDALHSMETQWRNDFEAGAESRDDEIDNLKGEVSDLEDKVSELEEELAELKGGSNE